MDLAELDENAEKLVKISRDIRNIKSTDFTNISQALISQNEIPITVEGDLLVEESIVETSIHSFKTALMQTIEKLNTTIDFLKNELEEKNLHIRALLFRDANDGNRIDIELLNNSPNKSLMKTTSPELHKIDFSINNIIEHVSQFNDSKQLISEQDTVVAKETNNCDCIHSRNSSLSLDSSITDDSCESSNDESNYSINRNLKIVDNYDIHNESLNDNSSITPCSSTIDVDKDIPIIDIMQSSCGKSS